MHTSKRLVDWFDTVQEALGTCFQGLPPGAGHFRVKHDGVEFTYNSIPGDHFQVQWGAKYTIVYFITGRARTPDRFVRLQTQVDDKIWVLSLDGLLQRDPLLRPDNTPNYPLLTRQWDTAGGWIEVRLDLTDTDYVVWKSSGQCTHAGPHAVGLPDQVNQAVGHIRAVIDQLNQEYRLRGLTYADPGVITRLERDVRTHAHIDPDATAEMVVNASLILPFCEAVHLHHKK